jgi:uncharacterized protein YfkK (UPF0435 family)
MEKESKKSITDNIVQMYTSLSEEFEERGQEVDNIGYYKDFEIKNSGLAISDAYIVKLKDKEDKIRDENEQKEKIIYEIRDDDNNLIASVNELGEIQFEEAYLESLREINEGYFDSLTLDEAEFELPEELSKEDLVLNKEEIEEKQSQKRIGDISKVIKSKEINSYSEMKTDQTPVFDKVVNKQEIDPNAKVTQGETLADMIPEIKQKGIVKVGVVYSDHSKGQNGRFSFVGIDKDGQIQTIDSLQNTQGATTGQTITSINSRDGSVVEQEQVSGLVKIGGRSTANGQEEMLSVRVGQYGILEVDYVRADLSRDKDERYLSAPIETKNQRPTTKEVREVMDKNRNTEIEGELERADEEIERDGDAELRNIDDTASNDELTPDEIIVLENGEETTLRKEAEKAKISPEEFTKRYNERGGKTPDEKIDSIHEEVEAEYGAPSLDHTH